MNKLNHARFSVAAALSFAVPALSFADEQVVNDDFRCEQFALHFMTAVDSHAIRIPVGDDMGGVLVYGGSEYRLLKLLTLNTVGVLKTFSPITTCAIFSEDRKTQMVENGKHVDSNVHTVNALCATAWEVKQVAPTTIVTGFSPQTVYQTLVLPTTEGSEVQNGNLLSVTLTPQSPKHPCQNLRRAWIVYDGVLNIPPAEDKKMDVCYVAPQRIDADSPLRNNNGGPADTGWYISPTPVTARLG